MLIHYSSIAPSYQHHRLCILLVLSDHIFNEGLGSFISRLLREFQCSLEILIRCLGATQITLRKPPIVVG